MLRLHVGSGDAEVGELRDHVAGDAAEEDVGRLHVAMDNSFFVRLTESAGDLLENGEDLAVVEGAARTHVLLEFPPSQNSAI